MNPTGPALADPAAAPFARALALHQRGELAQAGALYRQVLRAEPQHADALHLLGVVAAQVGNPQAAAELMGRALALDPDNPAVLANRGNALEDLGRVEEALAAFERAHALAPRQDFLLGMLLRTRQHLCRWEGWDAATQALRESLRAGHKAAMPFEVLSLLDEPALHLRCSRTYVRDRCAPDTALGPLPRRAPGARIHVAYFSSDFFDHATLHLLLEVLEQHDRSRFELTAFSYGPSRPDAWRARAAAAVDRLVDLNGMSDREAAALARRMGVDIAVDLKGHTNNARAGIFAFRAAPLQLAFLGYPGTLGQPVIDYAIADRTVVPDEALAHWAEKLVRLPGCYQPNMGTREVDATPPPRAHWGLPEGAFVYASFNAHYKITPTQWACWMRILGRVPGSVLWVLAPPAAARRALAAAAAAAAVESARVVFADLVPTPLHLARLRHADLMLDTFPYGAHTTASDALRMGLPVVTRTGASFASRVAASLLRTVGLPELVATDAQALEDLAVELAGDPQRLSGLRARLERQRGPSGLYDAGLFARRLEAAYTAVHERWLRGQPAAHLDLDEATDDTGTRRWSARELGPAAGADAYAVQPGAQALAAQARERFRAGEREPAAGLLRRALAIDPGAARLHSQLGAVLMAAGQAAAALEAFTRACALEPGDAEFHNNRGVALHALGQGAQAREAFGLALLLRPGYAAAARNLGLIGADAVSG